MCGIVGVLKPGRSDEEWEQILRAMTRCLEHRGPDDEGIWYDADSGIGLGHRRLSILDLSAHGHQPQLSRDGRYSMTYNGEVYNYRELKQELEAAGHFFLGRSDTEVILGAIQEWGLPRAVERFNGMFAFALWDRHERMLHLVRDRFGIKPLYYGWLRDSLVFASELKAFHRHPHFCPEISRDSLALLMRYSNIPAPYSIYRDVYKQLPGTILTFRVGTGRSQPEARTYWSLHEVAERARAEPFRGSEEEATEELDSLLRDSVAKRMISDVPVGVFLSGGVDSSALAALMQAQSTTPIKTFSIGFREEEFNEAHHACKVASHLGAEHAELYATPERAASVIRNLPGLYDEPFADASQIPTCLISELARQSVTVCLSGEGGDEIFGGYRHYERMCGIDSRYRRLSDLLRRIDKRSPGLRRALTRALVRAPAALADRLRAWRGTPRRARGWQEALDFDARGAILHETVSQWKDPEELVLHSAEPSTTMTDRTEWLDTPLLTELMMYLDTLCYLPNDLLTKLDRASMSVSLEARVPFLDHRVVAFAWSLPLSEKVNESESKGLLRKLLYRYVPRELIERPKMGFSVPLRDWLRGPLREWAEELLAEKRLRDDGYFNPAPVRRRWESLVSGRSPWHYNPLWTVLMFQSWLDDQHAGSR